MKLPNFPILLTNSVKFAAIAAGLAILVALLPGTASAQRDEIVALQREMAQVQQRIRMLEEANSNGFADIRQMLQQALASSGEISGDLNGLEERLTTSLATQQQTVVGPVQRVGTSIDGLAQNVVGLQESVTVINRRMGEMQTVLQDVSKAIRELATQQTSALPPPPESGNSIADALLQGAQRDLISGKEDLAFAAAFKYLEDYPNSAGAPAAQYVLGMIYDRDGNNEEAIQRFDAILEQYPENPTKRDAMYSKALSLRKAGRTADAIATLQAFVDTYPTDANAAAARALLNELR